MSVAPTPLPRSAPHGHRVARAALLAFLAGIAVALIAVGIGEHSSSTTTSIHGSGNVVRDVRTLPAFSSVDLAGSAEVVVTRGEKQSVVVSADDNLVRHVTTRVNQSGLVIGTVGSFTTRAPMRVEVTLPAMRSLVLSGSGLVVATDIRAPSLRISLSGSGVLRATGAVDRLGVSLGGSGDAQLNDLRAHQARAVVSGSGRIVLQVTDRLDASVPGSGLILYGGNPPNVHSDVTGSGAIVPG